MKLIVHRMPLKRLLILSLFFRAHCQEIISEITNKTNETNKTNKANETFVNLNEEDLNFLRRVCDVNSGEVWMTQSKKCERIFQKGPCGENQHVTLDHNTGIGKCKWKCEGKECCNEHQVLIQDKDNKTICDCDVEFVFWPHDHECYQLYSQGPCPDGEIISVESGNSSKCEIFNCLFNHIPLNGSCYEWGSQGPCLTPEEYVGINPLTKMAACMDTEIHNLVNSIASSICVAGTKRDYNGECRRVITPSFDWQSLRPKWN